MNRWQPTGETIDILWSCEREGTTYEVRNRDGALQLYTNGVFHSQWHPERPFAGHVWDCLSLPALYRPVDHPRRILLLGVGGGAAIRQLRSLVSIRSLQAIEIDPVHLAIARRWFRVELPGIELIEADAIDWVQNSTATEYDLVIDDLYGHRNGRPTRAHVLTDAWVERLFELAAPSGLVLVNCLDASELDCAWPIFADKGFRHGAQWSTDACANVIGVFSRQPLASRAWARALDATALDATTRRGALTIRREARCMR